MMKSSFLSLICLSAAITLASPAPAAESPDLNALQGKWQCSTKNDNGEKVTQVLEIKKDKFVFKILSTDGDVALYATGDITVEKLGPFNVFTAKNVRGGRSADSLEDVDEVFSHVYQLRDETLYVAAGFEKERERPPHLDVYSKVSSSK